MLCSHHMGTGQRQNQTGCLSAPHFSGWEPAWQSSNTCGPKQPSKDTVLLDQHYVLLFQIGTQGKEGSHLSCGHVLFFSLTQLKHSHLERQIAGQVPRVRAPLWQRHSFFQAQGVFRGALKRHYSPDHAASFSSRKNGPGTEDGSHDFASIFLFASKYINQSYLNLLP